MDGGVGSWLWGDGMRCCGVERGKGHGVGWL